MLATPNELLTYELYRVDHNVFVLLENQLKIHKYKYYKSHVIYLKIHKLENYYFFIMSAKFLPSLRFFSFSVYSIVLVPTV